MESASCERAAWLAHLERISRPVLSSLAAGRLHACMPVEAVPGHGRERAAFSALEAFARTVAGLAPWLELDGLEGGEARLQSEVRDLAVQGFQQGFAAHGPDSFDFSAGPQCLVEAAFLAQALVRAPRRLEAALPSGVRDELRHALRSTRSIRPCFNNWLLFSAMVETWLITAGEEPHPVAVEFALRQHEQWHLGGGVYGDGPEYHGDYYNSFVIHPMILDILGAVGHLHGWAAILPDALGRAQEHALFLERLVAPDGSYPALGRSITYRCGAFHLLAQLALQHRLPAGLPPGRVRRVLGSVIERTLGAPDTYDAGGWLRIGLSGHQPHLAQSYISTGSLYLCTSAFLPLGLSATDPFWTEPALAGTWSEFWR